jgi:membrane fusion protein, multidrug efflux system
MQYQLADPEENIVYMIDSNLTNSGNNKVSECPVFKILFLLLIAVMFSLPLLSCDREKKTQPEKMINVQVWTAEVKKVQPYLETTGTLKADEEVTVSSEVDGIIKKIYVEQGTTVVRGTLLIEINETDYLLDWKRSDAALKQAQASLANAQAEYKRKDALFQEELITKQQFDDISTRVVLAEADLDKAKATLETSKERLSRTKIYSPLKGAVKEKRVSVGDYVRNGTPLFQLIKTDPVKLDFTISEKDIAGLKIGQEVVFTVEALKDKQFRGRINLLYPNVEERTRTLLAEAITPNGDQVLKPGSFARVFIYTEAPREVVVAPITALVYDSGIIRIYVADVNNVARERIVKIGGKYGEYVEIMEGLNDKERVVVVGQNNLSEGVKLNVAR